MAKTRHLTLESNQSSGYLTLSGQLSYSLRRELSRSGAGIFSIQETHFSSKGKVQIENFEVFEAIRKVKEKGGTMVGVHCVLKPVLIQEINDPFELLVAEIKVAQKKRSE